MIEFIGGYVVGLLFACFWAFSMMPSRKKSIVALLVVPLVFGALVFPFYVFAGFLLCSSAVYTVLFAIFTLYVVIRGMLEQRESKRWREEVVKMQLNPDSKASAPRVKVPKRGANQDVAVNYGDDSRNESHAFYLQLCSVRKRNFLRGTSNRVK